MGGHTGHGLDSNQPIAAIFLKSLCPVNYKVDRYLCLIVLQAGMTEK